MNELFDRYYLPLEDWIETFTKDWLIPTFRPVFYDLAWPVRQLLDGLDSMLNWFWPAAVLVIVLLVAWRLSSSRVAIGSVAALAFLGFLGIWSETMTTLAMVLSAVTFCVAVGVPIGIIAARSDRFASFLRPVLDVMQTIPAFVYLIPVVSFFGIGTVPGVIATVIFSLPPIVRLTNLGIRQVDEEVVEAAYAFGSTPRQVLFEVQMPLAMRTIMAGLNQTLMLSLSMVVIAAIIGAGGLGVPVFEGLNRYDIGRATVGGFGLVVLAIVLDRITQGLGARPKGQRNDPISIAVRTLRPRRLPPATHGDAVGEVASRT